CSAGAPVAEIPASLTCNSTIRVPGAAPAVTTPPAAGRVAIGPAAVFPAAVIAGAALAAAAPAAAAPAEAGRIQASIMTTEQLVKALHEALGPGLKSVVLFGSAAAGDFVEGVSGHDVLIVAEKLGA